MSYSPIGRRLACESFRNHPCTGVGSPSRGDLFFINRSSITR